MDEAPKFHTHVFEPVALQVHHHRIPGLQVPGQGRHEHVSPVADQVVERYPQRVDAALELGDDILLIAALVGAVNDLGRAQVRARGDVEKVADLVEQDLLTFHLADILAQGDHPIRLFALAGLVVKFGHVLVVELQVDILALLDDALLLVGLKTMSGLPRERLVFRLALQPLPVALLKVLGAGDERSVGIHTKEEIDLLRPAVEVLGQRKVRVATHAHAWGVGRHLIDRLVDPASGIRVAGCVARPVDDVEHLLGVGQRHDQRRIAPDALVGDVHARLLLSIRGRHRAVDVDVGDRAQQVSPTPLPQRRPHRVDALHQFDDVRFGEATAEVPRRGRIGDQLRPQGVHVSRVVAQALDVFQPRAATHHVVGQVEHVVRLVIRQVHFQQMKLRVNRLRKSQLRHQAVHGRNAAKAHRVRVRTDLVVDGARGKHRLRTGRPVSCFGVSGRHLALTPCTVSPTLFRRYSLHRKGLLRWGSESCQNPANSNKGMPFRHFRTDPCETTRLVLD